MIALPWSIRRVFPGDDYARALSVINATGQLTVAIATTVHGLIFDMTGGYGASLTLNVLLYVLRNDAIITVAHGHPNLSGTLTVISPYPITTQPFPDW